MSGVEVLRFKHRGGSFLKAYVTVRVGDWVIHEWRVVKRDGCRAQVDFPQATWRGPDGRVRYQNLLELKQRIEAAILAAWEKERENGA
jgi:hypothetical protein